MYLSRLEIQGFKSFANKTVLDFQTGITAVVGPNGSGKSNVADALRWVLGEQSLKVLRGKRSEDVIFAGSDKKSRLGVAEVSLFLNNEDHSAPIDYSELVITRRVYRDGAGEYFINRQPARLQDIQLLLAQANFGQRTYSVIAQGMIDSLILSSPQERKHLFDEAAGVRQYQYKKDQAVSKLAQAKDNLTRGEAVMQEIEPRLRSLTRQVRRLERREEVEKTLREKQTLFFALRWRDAQREMDTVKNEFAQGDGRRGEIAKTLESIQHELETIEKERSASEEFASLQKQYNGILDEKNQLLASQASIKGKLESSARAAGHEATVIWQRRDQDVQRQLNQLEDDLEVLDHELERKKHLLQEQEAAMAADEQAFGKLEHQLKVLEQKLTTQYTMPQAKAAVSAFFAKYHGFVDQLHASETLDVAMIRAEAKKLREELSRVVEHLESAETDPQEIHAMQKSVVDMAKRRQTSLQEVMVLRGDVQLADQRRSQLDNERKKLAGEHENILKEMSAQELAKTNPDAAYAAAVKEAKDIEKHIVATDERLKTAREAINSFNTHETTKKDRLFALQKSFRDTQHQLNAATNAVNEIQVQIARLEQRQEDLRREIENAMGAGAETTIIEESAKNIDGDVALLAEEIGSLQHQLQLIGGIDEQVTNEFKDTNERWEFLNAQAEDLRSAIVSLEKGITELETTIKKKFDTAFKKIDDEFNQYFRTLFRGGRAELVLVQEVIQPTGSDEDEDDDEEENEDDDKQPAASPSAARVSTRATTGEKVITGIDIKATPPGKKLQNIAMLSGGERALTSIALLCAIIANNPSPFVALDEVDAALDEANSQRFAAIIDHLAHKTQFITITHNRATMEKATIMYGVTMGDDGVSQLLSVHMDEAEEIIKKHGNR